jgi:hypothetical protein
MSDSRVPVKCAPLLGQHTAELLSEWLGMGEVEIKDYIKETPLKKGTRDKRRKSEGERRKCGPPQLREPYRCPASR